jgi:hypothetical protein
MYCFEKLSYHHIVWISNTHLPCLHPPPQTHTHTRTHTKYTHLYQGIYHTTYYRTRIYPNVFYEVNHNFFFKTHISRILLDWLLPKVI